MAAFTSKATGDWNAAGQTTWNEVGAPVDGDTFTIGAAHTVSCAGACAATSGVVTGILAGPPGGSLTIDANLTGAGHVELEGAAGNVFTMQTKAGTAKQLNVTGTGSRFDHVDLLQIYLSGVQAELWNDVWQQGDGSSEAFLYNSFLPICTHTFWSDGRLSISQPARGIQGLESVAIGYRRDGTAAGMYANATTRLWYDLPTTIQNMIDLHGMNIESGRDSPSFCIAVDNLGYLPSAMLPGTGSDLDNAAVGPGIGKVFMLMGNIERSIAAKKTGDYGERMTPLSDLTNGRTLESSIYIPIATGDDISVSVYGRRHTMTNDCAEVEIDPEGAWFTPDTDATVLVNDDTWYEFTPSAAGAGGAGDEGMVRIVLRLKEYQSGAFFDWADMVVTVT